MYSSGRKLRETWTPSSRHNSMNHLNSFMTDILKSAWNGKWRWPLLFGATDLTSTKLPVVCPLCFVSSVQRSIQWKKKIKEYLGVVTKNVLTSQTLKESQGLLWSTDYVLESLIFVVQPFFKSSCKILSVSLMFSLQTIPRIRQAKVRWMFVDLESTLWEFLS